MATEKIEVEIVLDDGSIQRGFVKMENQAEKSGKKIKKNFDGSISKTLLGGLNKLKGALLGVAGAFAAAYGTRAAIRAAIRQENAVNQLNTALRLAGEFSEQASVGLQDFAREMQRVSTIGDETTLELFALARNFTKTNDEAQKLTEAAIQLSAATGMTLDGAVKNLGKTFAGLTGELGESLPQLRNLSPEALKAGAALDFVLQRFGGAAQAQTKTFGGALTQTTNLFGDLLESLGDFVVKSPAFIALIKEIGVSFGNMSDALRGANNMDFLGAAIMSMIQFADALNTFVVVPTEMAFNFIKTVTFAVLTAFQFIFDSFVKTIGGVAQWVLNLFGKKLPDAILEFSNGSSEALEFFANKTTESVDKTFNFELASSIDNFLTRTKNAVDQSDLFKGISDSAAKNSAKTQASLTELEKAIDDGVNKGMKAIVIQGTAAIGNALAKGTNAWDAFKNTVFGILGDFLIQVGSSMIAVGTAVEAVSKALKTFFGGGAILAGIALIALGGALKGLSGGAGGISGAAASTGGAAPGGAEPTVVEPEIQEKTTSVAINVEGFTVQDPAAVGEAIADVLNQAFDAKGTRLITT